MKAPIKYITDGFQNIIKGLGNGRNAKSNSTYVRNARIHRKVANDMYKSNWLAAKVIDAPIDDIMRSWREILVDDESKRAEIEAVLKLFKVKEKVSQAARWARLFGGAAIITMIDGEDPESPLDINRIRPGSLANFIILDRYNIFPGPIDREILSPTFGLPEFYTVVRDGQPIHRSRVNLFQGHISTLFEWEQNYYWGDPILDRLYDPIMDALAVGESITQLVYEANVDVFKMNGLNEMVATGNDEKVEKRLRLANEMKGVVQALVLDADDQYERKAYAFSHLADIDDRKIQKVAGASGIPVTRLVGISPAGMNSTGDNDMRNYYDTCEQYSENQLRPILENLDAIINASAFGVHEPLPFAFHPLQRLTPKEKAEVDHKRAARDTSLKTARVLTRFDILSQLAQDGTYVSIDANRIAKERLNPENFKLDEVAPPSGSAQEESDPEKREEENIERTEANQGREILEE